VVSFNQEIVQKVYEMKEKGFNNSQISLDLGPTREQVRRWTNHPEKFSPWVDGVAVDRALEGDRQVFLALTELEKSEFWARFNKRVNQTESELVTYDDGQTYQLVNPYLMLMSERLQINRKALTSMRLNAVDTQNRRNTPKAPSRGPGRRRAITPEQVLDVRKAVAEGASQNSQAKKYGVSKSCIWRACRTVDV
jgi:hypothetical protein